jgi:hypothetical protein
MKKEAYEWVMNITNEMDEEKCENFADYLLRESLKLIQELYPEENFMVEPYSKFRSIVENRDPDLFQKINDKSVELKKNWETGNNQ